MSVTRRGLAVFGICVLALGLGATFGARALNAVVVPALVALIAGWISVRRVGQPTVTRSRPAPGFPGEGREITLDIESGDATSATVRETVGDGLSADTSPITTDVPGRVAYDCRYERRGERAIGPATVTVGDALGLFERDFRAATRTDALVDPPVRGLSGDARRVLVGGSEGGTVDDRGEFDALREYVSGDPLRDVHWKSSAKRDEFVVTEFAPEQEREGLAIVAEAAPGKADEMATAAASVACWLLDRGIEIDLVTPDGRLFGVEVGTRERVLALLARAGAGRVATGSKEVADVTIAADVGGTTVTVDGETYPFDRLVEPRRLDGGHERASSRARAEQDGNDRADAERPAANRARADGGSGGSVVDPEPGLEPGTEFESDREAALGPNAEPDSESTSGSGGKR
jgi:uncharacterized protein (DUF58 family)